MGKGIGNAVEWYGVEQVINGYRLHSTTRENMYYSVWQGGVIKFTFEGGDSGEGENLLYENLNAWAANGNTALYTLKFHPELDKNQSITNQSPVNASGNFKLKDSFISGAAAPVVDSRMDKILELLEQQNNRLFQLEQESQTETEEDMEEFNSEDDAGEIGRILSGVNQIESAITQSPLLNNLYTDLRLGLRLALKKFGGEDYNSVNQQISGMQTETQQTGTQQGNRVDMSMVMRELVQAFPELPTLLVKLHATLKEDRDTFDLAKKKLIDGMSKL